MNGDGDSVLSSHICFNALATLQHLKYVENSCSFCSASDHSTYICPVLSQGEHVKDTSILNMSRSSVPHGLQVYEDDYGVHIVSMQKFARGCRFGPLLAPKLYNMPSAASKFPLIIFGNVNLDMDGINMPELKELFKVRHIYLDTHDETYCNWMIHVDPAMCRDEQNLVAYEEDNEIFFAAKRDLNEGDILKVWYTEKYAELMNAEPLPKRSQYPVMTNVYNAVAGFTLPDFQLLNSHLANGEDANRTEISLPPIQSLIKPSSYVCYDNRSFVMQQQQTVPMVMASPQQLPSSQPTSIDSSFEEKPADVYYINQMQEMDFSNVMSADAMTPNALHTSGGIATPMYIKEPATPYLTDVEDDLVDSMNDMASANSSLNNSDKEEKKLYPCQLCDKKYSTMTNIYRHVRAQHNFFLCSLCMHMFELESDLKEHIHVCPKMDERKPQCSVCMQYFSNSWSLTRHVKIHVTAGECDADVLVEKRAKDKKIKSEIKESIDLSSDIDRNSRDSMVTVESTTQSLALAIDYVPMMAAVCDYETENGFESCELPPIQPMHRTESNTSIDVCGSSNGIVSTGHDEISTCIVCEKKFKSKSYLKKHLRTVHTVKINVPTKRPSSGGTSTKSQTNPSKRSAASDINPAVTVTGAPVNPSTAKLLASKLTERSNQLNRTSAAALNGSVTSMAYSMATTATVTTTNSDVVMPPLVSIQHGMQMQQHSHQQHATNDMLMPITMEMMPSENVMPPTPAYTINDYEAELNVPTFNIMKTNVHANHNHIAVDNSVYEIAPFQSSATNDDLSKDSGKMHHCDLCGKTFNKKYELKRHKAVHENITFSCPYCAKVVKRKPSMLKHLRASHVDMESEWSQSNFVDTLKSFVTIDLEERSTSSPPSTGSPTSRDSIITSVKVIAHGNHDDATMHPYASSTKKKYSLNNNNVLPKAKKASTAKATKAKTADGASKKTGKPKGKRQLQTSNGGAIDHLSQALGDGHVAVNQNYTIVRSMPASMSHHDSHTYSTATATNGYQTGYIIQQHQQQQHESQLQSQQQQQQQQQQQHHHHQQLNSGTISDTIVLTNCDDGTANIVNNSKFYHNAMEHGSASEAVTAATVLLSSADGLLVGQPQAAQSNATNIIGSAPTTTNDYANIIDNCFFADDTLNVLHSPFSSDNDVDGFIIANANGGTTASNKELLNKFHDRLEEMEEKIDNAEYKLYWNGETDEENDGEENGVGDADDDDVVGNAHGHEQAATEFAELIVPKQHEFV